MTDWKERAERAEAELARLRTVEPVMANREDFEAWWEIFQAEHDEWQFADREAILFAAWQAALAAPPAQPAEPVQRLSDEQIDAVTRDKFGTSLLGAEIAMHREYGRAIESALQPGWRDDLVNGLMGSTISETCRADAAEAAIESIVELLDQHTDDLHVNHGCRPTESVSKARDIAIAALPPAPKATK